MGDTCRKGILNFPYTEHSNNASKVVIPWSNDLSEIWITCNSSAHQSWWIDVNGCTFDISNYVAFPTTNVKLKEFFTHWYFIIKLAKSKISSCVSKCQCHTAHKLISSSIHRYHFNIVCSFCKFIVNFLWSLLDCILDHNTDDHCTLVLKQRQVALKNHRLCIKARPIYDSGPLLPTWFNFNPSVDK